VSASIRLNGKPARCAECGSTSLTWEVHSTICAPVAQGRLTTTDVRCIFLLSCDDCSATVASLTADEVAAAMQANSHGAGVSNGN